MKTISFTNYELVIIRDALEREETIWEDATISDCETEFNTEKQIEKFGNSIREIHEKIGYISKEQIKKVFPEVRKDKKL